MKTTVEVSVVTTSMNYGRYLEDCIQSIQHQKANFPFKINHLILDGGSTDKTHEILEVHRNKIHSHITQGESQTHALNHALDIINRDFPDTEYVGWLNADDYYSPNWLESSLSTHQEHDVAVTCSNHNRFSTLEGGGFMTAKVAFQGEGDYVDLMGMLEANSICQPTVCIRLSAFNALKKRDGYYFNPDIDYCQDYELWLRFLLHGYSRIRRIRDYLATLRVHPVRLTLTHAQVLSVEENYLRETMKRRYNE